MPNNVPAESPLERLLLVLIVFLSAGSGLAALLYEVVWFQLLELVIGSSAISLAVLLATFMAGTCLGSLIFPRFVGAGRNPLKVYALIEVGIGVLGLLMLRLIPFVGSLYTAWAGYGLRGFLLRGLVATICLFPPTLLMGATLPALARRLKSVPHHVSWLGLFYGSNIAGAVAGALVSGFYLLRRYDVATTTGAAAAVNLMVAILALVLSSIERTRTVSDVGTGPIVEVEATGKSGTYIAIGLSGFCALSAEAIWTRNLGLLFGASVYTFSIILAVFLIGLGIGSGIGALLCRIVSRPRLALGWCQLLSAGAIAWTAYSAAASLPYWPIDPSISSDIWFNFQMDLDRAFWALLPPTLLWGASFPLALAAVGSNDRDPARLFANVYAANTIGAIGGVLISSLLLVAWVGSQHSEQFLITLATISALVLMLPLRQSHGSVSQFRWRTAAAGIVITVLGAFWIRCVPPLDKLLIAHGRYAATWRGKSDVIYAEEGLNASVAVSSFPSGALTFHVAGKIQASSVARDMRLQRMLGHLTTLAATNPRSVLVIGCGAGITAGAVSIDPIVERVTIVEIEPLVPDAAATYFGRQNFDVLGNPKVTVKIDDARHYLLTASERFDAITSDPLDPWVKGAATLYTKEFLELVRKRLNPGGVVTLYIQLFETNVEAVKSSLATFFDVFPNGTIWGNTYEGRGHDMVLMAQAEPGPIDLDNVEKRLTGPDYASVAQSLQDVEMNSAADLFSTYAGRGSDLGEWLKGAEINRDGNLRMQYLAGLGLNLDDSATIYSEILAYRHFPEDLFTSRTGRVEALRSVLHY